MHHRREHSPSSARGRVPQLSPTAGASPPPPRRVRCQREASPDRNDWHQAQDSCGLDKANPMLLGVLDTETQSVSPRPERGLAPHVTTAHVGGTAAVPTSLSRCLSWFKDTRIPFSFKAWTAKAGTQAPSDTEKTSGAHGKNQPQGPFSDHFSKTEGKWAPTYEGDPKTTWNYL